MLAGPLLFVLSLLLCLGSARAAPTCLCGFVDPTTNSLWTDALITYFNESSPSSDVVLTPSRSPSWEGEGEAGDTGTGDEGWSVVEYANDWEDSFGATWRSAAVSSNARIEEDGIKLVVEPADVKERIVYGAAIVSRRRDILYGSFRAGIVPPEPGLGGTVFKMAAQYNLSSTISSSLLTKDVEANAKLEWDFSSYTHASSPRRQLLDDLIGGWRQREHRFDWAASGLTWHVDSHNVSSTTWSVEADRNYVMPRAAAPLSFVHSSNGEPTLSQGPPLNNSASARIVYARLFFNSSRPEREDEFMEQCEAQLDRDPCSTEDLSLRTSTFFPPRALQRFEPSSDTSPPPLFAVIMASIAGGAFVILMAHALVKRWVKENRKMKQYTQAATSNSDALDIVSHLPYSSGAHIDPTSPTAHAANDFEAALQKWNDVSLAELLDSDSGSDGDSDEWDSKSKWGSELGDGFETSGQRHSNSLASFGHAFARGSEASIPLYVAPEYRPSPCATPSVSPGPGTPIRPLSLALRRLPSQTYVGFPSMPPNVASTSRDRNSLVPSFSMPTRTDPLTAATAITPYDSRHPLSPLVLARARDFEPRHPNYSTHRLGLSGEQAEVLAPFPLSSSRPEEFADEQLRDPLDVPLPVEDGQSNISYAHEAMSPFVEIPLASPSPLADPFALPMSDGAGDYTSLSPAGRAHNANASAFNLSLATPTLDASEDLALVWDARIVEWEPRPRQEAVAEQEQTGAKPQQGQQQQERRDEEQRGQLARPATGDAAEEGARQTMSWWARVKAKLLASDGNKTTASGAKRVQYLDGLRGFACLAVSLHHFILMFYHSIASPTSPAHYPRFESIFRRLLGPLLVNGGLNIGIFFLLAARVIANRWLVRGRLEDLAEVVVRRVPRLMVPITAAVIFSYFLMQVGAFVNVRRLPSRSWSTWAYFEDYDDVGAFVNAWIQLWFISPPATPLMLTTYATGILWTVPLIVSESWTVFIAALVARQAGDARKRYAFYAAVFALTWWAGRFSMFFIAGLVLADADNVLHYREWAVRGFKVLPGVRLSGQFLAWFLFLLGTAFSYINYNAPPSLSHPLALSDAEYSIHPDWETALSHGKSGQTSTFVDPSVVDLVWVVGFFTLCDVCAPFGALFTLRFWDVLGRNAFSLYLLHGPIFWSIGSSVVLHLLAAGASYWASVLLGFLTSYALLLPLCEGFTRSWDRWGITLSRALWRSSSRGLGRRV